jgi:hypothetical protein
VRAVRRRVGMYIVVDVNVVCGNGEMDESYSMIV